MSLSLLDHWIWDFWFVKNGPDFHIYYLQAPKSLGDPGKRHWHATIGHAVSNDLQHWEILPDALKPSSDIAAWDSLATWTGSVIEFAGLWYMAYTGVCQKEDGLIQRIGVAISDDLIHWKKYEGNPVLVSDPGRYEQLDPDLWHDQAWRDPWLMKSPRNDTFFAYITARVNYGPVDGRGVIVCAESKDLLVWEVMNPVTEPGEFGHMEIPQVTYIQGSYNLLFSTTREVFSQRRIQNLPSQPVTGTHYLISENPTGPFRNLIDEFLIGDYAGTQYGGKLVEVDENEFVLLAMRHCDPDGIFVGELADPVPIRFGNHGEIRLEALD